MADRRIYAGYYRRYDGKVIYAVTIAKDADTGEDPSSGRRMSTRTSAAITP